MVRPRVRLSIGLGLGLGVGLRTRKKIRQKCHPRMGIYSLATVANGPVLSVVNYSWCLGQIVSECDWSVSAEAPRDTVVLLESASRRCYCRGVSRHRDCREVARRRASSVTARHNSRKIKIVDVGQGHKIESQGHTSNSRA